MQQEKTRTIEDAKNLQIPEPLMAKLHAADERLKKAKAELEAVTGGTEYNHEASLEAVTQRVRDAETEVEAANQEIATRFHQK